MSTSKKKIALWVGGLAAGVIAGTLIYQNRHKLAPQKEKLTKLAGNLQKLGLEIGKRLKTV